MDNQNPVQQPVQPTPVPQGTYSNSPPFQTQNQVQSLSLKNKILFILVGFVLLTMLFAGGAYVLNTNQAKSEDTVEKLSKIQKPTEFTQIDTPIPQISLTTIPSPTTQEQTPWQIYTSTQLPGTSFLPYSLQFPSSWKTNTTEYGIFRLIKNDYEIAINQNGPHGYDCIFEGTPDGPERDLRNVTYTQFENNMGTWRRFQDTDAITKPDTIVLDLCIKSAGNGGFVDFSNIGAVSYSVPKTNNEQVLKEMDDIVKTIKAVR